MYYIFLLSHMLIDLWGWFYALAVVNSATVSTGVQISLWYDDLQSCLCADLL